MALKGVAQMKGNLRKVAERYPIIVGGALVEELEVEKRESQRRIPVKSGAAQGTAEVVGPEIQKGLVSAAVVYGADPDVTNPDGVPVEQYIVPLHEDLDAFHPNGEAKFLESTMTEAAPHLGERIARRAQLDKVKL